MMEVGKGIACVVNLHVPFSRLRALVAAHSIPEIRACEEFLSS